MEIFHMTDIISLIGISAPAQGRSSFYVQCPCCDDSPRKKHLNINLKKEVYRCPRCGISGGIFDLYSLYTGIPRDKVRKRKGHNPVAERMPVSKLMITSGKVNVFKDLIISAPCSALHV